MPSSNLQDSLAESFKAKRNSRTPTQKQASATAAKHNTKCSSHSARKEETENTRGAIKTTGSSDCSSEPASMMNLAEQNLIQPVPIASHAKQMDLSKENQVCIIMQ